MRFTPEQAEFLEAVRRRCKSRSGAVRCILEAYLREIEPNAFIEYEYDCEKMLKCVKEVAEMIGGIKKTRVG